MAKVSIQLIEKLRETASNLESGANYSWGHVARCNCGHLAQSLLTLSNQDIYQAAQTCGLDEWTEFANEYCPASGRPMDEIMDAMFAVGLELKDIHELEYLSNREILNALPGGFRYLEKGKRENTALYMRTWASLLELKLKSQTSAVSELLATSPCIR
ncbi:MAG: hypothetical protein ACON4O_08075 [Lentimonas sp.]